MNSHKTSDAHNEAHAALPVTERRLAQSMELDSMTVSEVLRLMNDQDRIAVDAVSDVVDELASLVETAVALLREGGTVHYFGAGTSGRLGALDAAELVPTFNLAPGVFTAHIAGGSEALVQSVENSEDSVDEGESAAAGLGVHDLAIGLAASGNTPYVGGALHRAHQNGARTALISCNPLASLAPLADQHIALRTGAEVVTGSTRLKAGTAQKMALNSFSTAVMVELGRTFSNLMVSVVATNDKLRDRTVRILAEATGLSRQQSVVVLEGAGGDLRVALASVLGDATPDAARAALGEANESVRHAVALLHRAPADSTTSFRTPND
jgi:N-acetylmuramic acid 6-phosphate etherase